MEEKESKEAGSPDMDGVEGEHMKAMWAGQSNVLVAVRVRPLMKHDVIKKSCVRVLDNKVVVILDPALAADKVDILRANRNREKQYAFDYVLDPTSTQDSAYLHTTKFLIHGVLDGFNATVFAYGQTGSGKTHTMIGSPSDPGIMVKVMEDLFIYSASQCKQQGNAHRIIVSFLEVYNENIRDLLSDVEEYLDLREDPIKGPVVSGITEVETKSSTEIMNLLHQGNAKRFQAATAANEVSSRSHAVLQVVVESKDRAPGVVANIKVGKLSLVDLAGSERAANTKNTGARLVEGANINRSLLALGNCINALGEKGNKGNFVPYRDSKLTRLLKDSLGGNCRTVMIANISSSESAFEETLNTLKYANRAKNIKTNVQRNVLNVNYHISEYVQLINNLRGEIKLLKDQISLGGIDPPIYGDVAKSFSRGGMGFGGLVANAISPQHGGNAGLRMPSSPPGVAHAIGLHPTTPLHILRESMRSATQGADREVVNSMRQKIVENFQERMQLRRSLIELEDQNVQNSIEVSKRQLIVVQWSETRGNTPGKKSSVESKGIDDKDTSNADFAADLIANGTSEIKEAWQECEQLRKAILKNNGMKKSIAKRLRHNEREAEKFRDELSTKITGEDRRELMELQYQVGRLELENMELEQHRIVHESILKGKDLVIQKLKLQLAVRDKLINRQQTVLKEHSLDDKVGYSQLALMEQTLMGDTDLTSTAPPSPPRNLNNAKRGDYGSGSKLRGNAPVVPMLDINHIFNSELNESIDSGYTMPDIKDVSLTDRDRESIEAGDWSEIHSELSDDASFHNGPMNISSFGSNSDNKNSHLSSNYGNKQPTGSKFTKQIERLERDRADNYNNESKQLEINGKILRADLAIRAQRGGRLITRVNANNSNEMTPNGGNFGYNHMVNGVESNDSIGVLSGDKMVIEKPLRPQNPRKNHSFPDFNQFSETPVLEADAKYNSNVVCGKDMHNGDNKVDWDRDRVMREDKDYYLNNKGRRGQDIVNFNFGDIPLNISPDGKVLGLQHGRNQVNNEERDKELFERALENRQANNNNRNKVKGSNQNVSEWSDDNVPLSGRGRYNEIIANNTNNKFVHDEFGEDSIDTVLSDNSENSERHKGSHVKVVPFNSNNHNIVKENNMANLQLASNIYLQGGPALPSNSRADKNLALGKLKNKISSNGNVNNIEMNEIIGPANIIERPQNPPTHGLSINNIGFGGIGQILAPVTDRIVAAPNAAGIGGISRPLQYNKNKLSNANNRNIIKNNINNSLANDSVVAGPVSNAGISNSNTSVGGIVIPNIGGRNRSLPNLPKDRQPQPLSARSQASKDVR